MIMRSVLILMAIAGCVNAQLVPRGGPQIVALTSPSNEVAVDEMRAFRCKDREGLDRKSVRWEPDPVYAIGRGPKGEPVLVAGDLAVLNIAQPVSALVKSRGEDPKVIELYAGDVAVWGKTSGQVRLVARGSVNGVTERVDSILLTVAGSAPLPPVAPAPPSPPQGVRSFLIVGPSGPALPEVESCLRLPGWDAVRKAGISVRYLPVDKVPSTGGGLPIPPGTTLPCLLELAEGESTSRIVPPPRSLPKTDAEIQAIAGVN